MEKKIYVHKDYADMVVPKEVLDKAKAADPFGGSKPNQSRTFSFCH